jgi:hypothetical protein
MDPREQHLQEQCDRLSLRVQRLCLFLVVGEILYLVWAAQWTSASSGGYVSLLAPLVLLTILWLSIQRVNHQLVSCGSQEFRHRFSPRNINRPEFAVRMAYHLVINWSLIPLLQLAAFVLAPSAAGRYLAYLSVLAIAVIWTRFNVMHRRKNALRNLLSTSVIAAALVLVSLSLVI